MAAVTELATAVGTRAACRALFASRASHYRQRRAAICSAKTNPRPSPPRALAPAERETVLAHLHGERFQDCSPAAVNATLLDEGQYLCSIRTMYRMLEEKGESRERRDQFTHPPYQKPELLATAPNQLWSWDITKLLGPAKWTYFYLYVILDVFSRYVIGWMVAMRESAELAKRLIEESCAKAKYPARPTHTACRPRHFHAIQTSGLLAGRLGCHQDPQPPACLQRQSLFGKPVPHHEISPGVPGPFRLHSRQPRFFPGIFPLVQRGTSPLRVGSADSRYGPLQPNCAHSRTAPNRSRCRLSRPSRTLRPPGSQASSGSNRGLDQQTAQLK